MNADIENVFTSLQCVRNLSKIIVITKLFIIKNHFFLKMYHYTL